jgi:hypothetical protein
LRTYKNQIFFWFTSNPFLQRPVSSKYWLLHPFSTRKPHAKAVTSKDYFTHLRTLKNWPQLLRVSSTALLSHWGRQLLKDMTSLGTDFEMHAIWQGYIENPVAKDFLARKARTIALSKAQGARQSTLFTSLEIPWGFHTRAVLRSLAGLMSHEKVSV